MQITIKKIMSSWDQTTAYQTILEKHLQGITGGELNTELNYLLWDKTEGSWGQIPTYGDPQGTAPDLSEPCLSGHPSTPRCVLMRDAEGLGGRTS